MSTDGSATPSQVGSYSPPDVIPAPPQAPPAASNGTALAQATPTSLVDVIAILADKADPLVKLISASIDRYQKGKEREVKFQAQMAWAALSVVFLIIGVAAWMTYLGKVDGSTFAFLLGLIVGYVLTFIRDQVRSPES